LFKSQSIVERLKIPLRLRSRAWAVVLLALAAAACRRDPQLLPPGPLLVDRIELEMAVYYLAPPQTDPIAALDKALADYPGLRRAGAGSGDGPAVAARVETDGPGRYPPPDVESLRSAGHGLDAAQGQALQRSPQVLVLRFAHGRAHVWDGLRRATQLTGRLAREAGGLAWDQETREVFTPQAWEERLTSWSGEIPDLRSHFTLHAYRDGNLLREVTLGLGKVGLPDLVFEALPASDGNSAGNLMNLLAQEMAEGGRVGKDGAFELALDRLADVRMRAAMRRLMYPDGLGVAQLVLRKARPRPGDADNRLVAIGVDRYPGEGLQERQEALLSSFWGHTDAVTHLDHTPEILAASRRAQAKLPALRDAFNAGLAPGDVLLLKAPFRTPQGGKEWMWIEVTSWRGRSVRGLLQNDPIYIPDLHAGAEVAVDTGEVFDYILQHDNDTSEGNETGDLMEAGEKRKFAP
jgi:hypothetical protein